MIQAELSEKRDKIIVRFPYNKRILDRLKEGVPGRRFVPEYDGGPFWTIPADMISAKRLRRVFDGEIEWGPNVLAWGREQRAKEDGLVQMAHAVDYPLEELRIARELPKLAEWLRGYQRADIKFLASTSAINANQQGLGKTPEAIAAVYEAGLGDGPHLVIAPVTSLEVVWEYELDRWLPEHVKVLASESPGVREKLIREAYALWQEGIPFWLCINPDMVRYESIKEWDPYKEKMVEVEVREKYPELFAIPWNSITFDEFHKAGLNNPKTLTSRAIYNLHWRPEQRRWAMSGTPMGGVPLKLFGALKFVQPKEYSSKWRWAEQWLEVADVDIGRGRKAKEIGGLKKGIEDEFYRYHARHMVRHTKAEVLPQLPPKQYVDVWCNMSKKHQAQYKAFERDAEIRIDEHHLSAQGILAEYARLKTFATALCEIEPGKDITCRECDGGLLDDGTYCTLCGGEGYTKKLKLKPTYESAKLTQLMAKLSEIGIDPKEPWGDACAVVASQSIEVVDMVHRHLNELGIKSEKITGKVTKPGERKRLIQEFQEGGTRVMLLTTTAGGVAITLDRADTIHILDETWVPDDQEQVEDRIHRMSRLHQVTCYYYRTRGTIEEYIREVNEEKAFTNESILDTRRKILARSKAK